MRVLGFGILCSTWLTSLLATFLLTSPSWGASIKVKKVKGKSATVIFKDMTPEAGEVYQIADDGAEIESGSAGGQSRGRTLGLGGGFSSASGVSAFGIGGRYGWNSGIYEYGAIFNFLSGKTNISGGSLGSEGFTLGGFFDYNLTENRPGQDGIPAVTAQVVIGSTSGKSSTTIQLGGSYKWFALGTSTCLRADALLTSVSVDGVSDSLMGLQLGLQTYF